MKVIVPFDFYSPAFKAGGPIRSIENIVNLLSGDFDFNILAKNIDLDGAVLESVSSDVWYENPSVIYLDECKLKGKLNYIRSLIRISKSDDILYLNSFFSIRSTLIPLLLIRINILKYSRVILAPRGELIKDALSSKFFKKKWFIKITNYLGLYREVVFHSTSDEESISINNKFKNELVLCENLPSFRHLGKKVVNNKEKNILKCVYSARIHPHKNLFLILQALNIAKQRGAEISLDVFGLKEDDSYYTKCNNYIVENELEVIFHGAVDNVILMDELPKYDLFVLSTLSENFGHSIAEALSLGIPVLISNRTPFLNLECYSVGFDLPLDIPLLFAEKMIYFSQLSKEEMQNYKENSKSYMRNRFNTAELRKSYLNLFKVKHV
ncbi:glycosyltransferase [Pseudoalteromonas sp. SG44-17]|uniref:glycosyltransferase n=1 Tax=Pseudoalteromonas sp. SG44-17 TaxID=2760963 RepID=UPI001602F650|nr:glycosyltransferase [Pseudoalteromonas sp. SG44-17]MBB1411675.1 glycosyltransferase [Pseudoalteromonas sp. SG44-17]